MTPPSETFPLVQGMQLEVGEETVEVAWPGPGHTEDNVVVYFPQRRLLFGGCLVLGRDKIGNSADADLVNWAESVRTLDQYDVDIVIPGHGDRLDPGLVEHTIALLEEA